MQGGKQSCSNIWRPLCLLPTLSSPCDGLLGIAYFNPLEHVGLVEKRKVKHGTTDIAHVSKGINLRGEKRGYGHVGAGRPLLFDLCIGL